MFFRRVICIVICLISLMLATSQTFSQTTDRPTLLQETIALRAQLASETDPLQIIALTAQLAQKEVLFLQPSATDFAVVATTLTQPDTGLIRILPRGKYDAVLQINGAGAYYSFARQTHAYGYGSDVELQQGRLSVGFAGADFGFLVSLGNNVSLTDINLSSPGVKYLADYNAPLTETEARAEYQRSGTGFQVDGYSYRSSLPAGVNNTFALRSVGYGDSDSLVMLRVVRQDTFDDSLIILWKMLKRFATPQLNGAVVANVTGANYTRQALAPESIVAGFGSEIANGITSATGATLPTTLGGVSISVQDSTNKVRSAPLFVVTPNQVNYQIPANTAIGAAIVTIRTASGKQLSENVLIKPTAPGIFTATSDGQGLAAAVTQKVTGIISTYASVVQFDSVQNKFVAVPIDLGNETDRVYLLLYTSGVRFRKDLSSVKVTIGGLPASVEYAGAQGFFTGVDQINVLIPRSLIGKGETDVTMTVDGVTANTVKVNIK